MSLRTLAETDLGNILADTLYGFAWDITVTAPDGTAYPLTGFSNDIAQMIDPDTGLLVSGRIASVALRIQDFRDLGLDLPRRVSDETTRPWLVGFDDINGVPYTFAVRQSDPDRALGLLILILEAYGV